MRAEPHTPARHRSPDRHVSVPRDDRHVVAEDRPAFRRPGPHHCDARRSQDPDADGRAAQRVQPGHRADQPDKAAGFPALTGTESSYLFSALHHLPTTGDNTVYNSGYLAQRRGDCCRQTGKRSQLVRRSSPCYFRHDSQPLARPNRRRLGDTEFVHSFHSSYDYDEKIYSCIEVKVSLAYPVCTAMRPAIMQRWASCGNCSVGPTSPPRMRPSRSMSTRASSSWSDSSAGWTRSPARCVPVTPSTTLAGGAGSTNTAGLQATL